MKHRSLPTEAHLTDGPQVYEATGTSKVFSIGPWVVIIMRLNKR